MIVVDDCIENGWMFMSKENPMLLFGGKKYARKQFGNHWDVEKAIEGNLHPKLQVNQKEYESECFCSIVGRLHSE